MSIATITQAEYARHRGVSKAAVSKAVKAGRITLTKDGRVNREKADADWARNSTVRAGAGHPIRSAAVTEKVTEAATEPAVGDPDYFVARARREEAEAQRAELEVAQMRGTLVEVAVVERVWGQACAGMREQLLQMRSRLAPLLAAESDQFKVERLLDVEISQTLQTLASAQLPRVAA